VISACISEARIYEQLIGLPKLKWCSNPPSFSRSVRPDSNATQAVFKRTEIMKHEITENHGRSVGILSCLGRFGLKCRYGYRLTPKTLSEFRASTSSGLWPFASSAFAVYHLPLIARFDAIQFKPLTASSINHNRQLKANQSHYRPEVPSGFQEVKVPRLRDNGPGWW